MIREVHPNLFVGDGQAPADLKGLAGYWPGEHQATCQECGIIYRSQHLGLSGRCLDCALKHIAETWFIIHAAKEPWHRDAVGYTERGAPPNHPEYLVAMRPGEMMLNLVDMKRISPQYTNPIFEAAFDALDLHLGAGKKVLVHCNEGKSRAPTLAMLYLHEHIAPEPYESYEDMARAFREVYPDYEPGEGFEDYARSRWGTE